MLTHLSLFSGIGGLDLAAEWAGFVTVGQCEWADYPTKVLEKHWPDVPRWRDIHDLTASEFVSRTGIRKPTVISGGFPCQPHSKAGKRRASSDERDLWPEMRRVICELRPRWVVAENVRGLLSSEGGRFFRGILRDFSDMGFDVGWCCVLAADFGGVHRRERMGIIAHARESRRMDCKPKVCGVEWAEQAQQDVASGFNYDGWGERCNAFKPKLLGNDDGIPNWVDRIECIGNAVAPPQFYPFFKAIADIEEDDT